MKKYVNIRFIYFLLVAAVVFISSCKKEESIADEMLSAAVAAKQNTDNVAARPSNPVKRAYRDSFTTAFGFVPDFANGWTPPNPAPAWYPGSGDGNVAHMGKAKTYFNQYATFGPAGLISSPAPVIMFFSSELAGLNIPMNVTSVVMDNKGNAIWFQSSGSTTTPVSPTRINFTGEASIVGGNGKFAGATGEVVLNGYFNPQNPNDASSWQYGWIKY